MMMLSENGAYIEEKVVFLTVTGEGCSREILHFFLDAMKKKKIQSSSRYNI